MPLRRLVRLRSRRGGSLVEVLVAMAILAMLMVGVLQLFSLSLLTDSGSAARTDMTLKAQQVAENLRYLHFLRKQSGAMPTGTGLPATPSNGLRVDLPWQASDAGWAYWGPAGANVFEQEKPPYRISYTYSTSATPPAGSWWFVTVAVVSENAPTGMNYIGPGAKVKRVDYVCQVPR